MSVKSSYPFFFNFYFTSKDMILESRKLENWLEFMTFEGEIIIKYKSCLFAEPGWEEDIGTTT